MDTVLTIAEAMAQKDKARAVEEKESGTRPNAAVPKGSRRRKTDG